LLWLAFLYHPYPDQYAVALACLVLITCLVLAPDYDEALSVSVRSCAPVPGPGMPPASH